MENTDCKTAVSATMKITRHQNNINTSHVTSSHSVLSSILSASYIHPNAQYVSNIYISAKLLNKSLPQNPLILASGSFIGQKSCRHERILQKGLSGIIFTNDTFVWGAMCIQNGYLRLRLTLQVVCESFIAFRYCLTVVDGTFGNSLWSTNISLQHSKLLVMCNKYKSYHFWVKFPRRSYHVKRA